MRKDVAVFAIYSSQQHAEEAVEAIRGAGFRAEDISVMLPENVGSKDFGHERHTKAPEAASAGAATVGVLGGALGWLVGIGALAIPGVGPFIAAGPIMAALAGVGAGSVIGGLAGALVGLGMPEYEAKRYEGRIRSGGVLLSVHCPDDHWLNRAKEMLRHTGGEDVAVSPLARGGVSSSARSDEIPRDLPHADNVRTERVADSELSPRDRSY